MTQITEVSVKNLLRISLPMMIAFMSNYAMLFVNRIMLADYSLAAMNGVATAGLVAATFQFGAASIAAISEVFVGQYNGSRNYQKIGEAVWQMIWFSLASQLIFFLIAFYFSDSLIPVSLHEYGLTFFKVSLYFGCLQALFSALSGFYVGQGKPTFVTIAAVIGNLVNLGLNPILIFGWKIIPSLGALGSAIATVIALWVQFLILFVLFLKKSNRQTFGTNRYRLNLELILNCLRIGTPAAVGHMLEIAAWSAISHIMAALGSDYITINNLCNTFFLTFCFFTEGLHKGVIAIASNLIGANDLKKINALWTNGVLIHLSVLAGFFIIFFIYPDRLSSLFSIPAQSPLAHSVAIAMRFLWLFFLFDGLIWVISGVLVSAGDTKFIMVANTVSAWFFAVLPLKVITSLTSVDAGHVWGILMVYAFINCCAFYHRYRSQKWLKLHLEKKVECST
jgi:multidrug resistance protein, MATE family